MKAGAHRVFLEHPADLRDVDDKRRHGRRCADARVSAGSDPRPGEAPAQQEEAPAGREARQKKGTE